MPSLSSGGGHGGMHENDSSTGIHRLPSGPTATSVITCPRSPASGNSVMSPAGVTRPKARAVPYQTFPSGPSAHSNAKEVDVGRGNSVTPPEGVILPIHLGKPPNVVNQRFPSEPTVRPYTEAPDAGYSMKLPERVMRQIERRVRSENQIAPSGPTTIAFGL